MTRRIVVAALLLVTTGCGEHGRAPEVMAPSAHVVVTVLAPPSDESRFTEGSVPFVMLIDARGARTDVPDHVAVDVDPGRYTVLAGHRPCDANCGTLDPPVDTCRSEADLVDGSVRITVALHDGAPCRVAVAVTPTGPRS